MNRTRPRLSIDRARNSLQSVAERRRPLRGLRLRFAATRLTWSAVWSDTALFQRIPCAINILRDHRLDS